MTNPLLDRITDKGIIYTSALSIPMNVIIFIALRNSEFPITRFIPPLLTIAVILLTLFRKKIPFEPKAWIFIATMFLVGCFNLLLGLIDLASLWFVLSIIFTVIVSEKQEALRLFLAATLLTTVTGILMMMKLPHFPLKYGFQDCQFACVGVRILHFILMGSLSLYVLKTFLGALKTEMAQKIDAQKKLLGAVVETEESERKRFAAELHDGLGPVMSAAKLYFQAYVDAAVADKGKIQLRLQEILCDAISDISRISHSISPHILESSGLIAALGHFLAPIEHSGRISIVFDHDVTLRCGKNAELALYRCITELISNTIKHSGADRITLSMSDSDLMLAIRYSDNGKGFDTAGSDSTGMGLLNIRNRIGGIGGTVTFESAEGSGTRVHIELPIEGDPR